MLQRMKSVVEEAVTKRKAMNKTETMPAKEPSKIRVDEESGYIYTGDVEWNYSIKVDYAENTFSLTIESSRDRKSVWEFGAVDTTKPYEDIIKEVLDRFRPKHYTRLLMMTMRDVRKIARVLRYNSTKEKRKLQKELHKANREQKKIKEERYKKFKDIIDQQKEMLKTGIPSLTDEQIDKFIAWTCENKGFGTGDKPKHWGRHAINIVSTAFPLLQENKYKSLVKHMEQEFSDLFNRDRSIGYPDIVPLFIRFYTIQEMSENPAFNCIREMTSNEIGRVSIPRYSYAVEALYVLLKIITENDNTSNKSTTNKSNSGFVSLGNVFDALDQLQVN